MSDRDAYATAYSDAHGDRNASPYRDGDAASHGDTNRYAGASANGNAHPSARRWEGQC